MIISSPIDAPKWRRFFPEARCYQKTDGARAVDTVVIHSTALHEWKYSYLLSDLGHLKDAYLKHIQTIDRRSPIRGVVTSILMYRAFGVSPHYIIDTGGKVYQLVGDVDIAYHAGKGIMPSPDLRQNINTFSIGVELLTNPHGRFTAKQYRALAELLDSLYARHDRKIVNVVGHDDIAGEASIAHGVRAKDDVLMGNRIKKDPGPNFNWPYLLSLVQSPIQKLSW